MSNGNFQISQEYELIPPEKSKAYPIFVHEWNFIKDKISKIKINFQWFDSIGFLLIGAGISCLVTGLTSDFTKDIYKIAIWGFFTIFILAGILSLFFGYSKRKQENTKPSEITDQMNLIENRFKNEE